MDKILGLIGLAKKAGRLEVGEEPAGAAARAKDARLLLVARDAAANTVRRAGHFADAGACLMLRLPATKYELGRAVGRTSCAIAAVTDIGFAETIAKRLAALDESFRPVADALAVKAKRAAERRAEAEQHEKNVRSGKKHKAAPKEKQPPAPPEERKAPAPREKQQSAPAKRPERADRRRKAAREQTRKRFENARPVKKGKGSKQ